MIKKCLEALLELILFYVLSFFLLFSFLHCLQCFIHIHSSTVIIVALSGSLIIALVIMIVRCLNGRKFQKEGEIEFWINQNLPQLAFCYVIFILFLLSVTNVPVWNKDEVKDVLTIEWTIFGISTTVFLIWRVLIVNYLREKQPVNEDYVGIQRLRYLYKKRALEHEISFSFLTVVLLAINLFLLLTSTSLAYIGCIPKAVITQNLIRATFFFSTNTLATLFLDIFKPIKKDRDALKKANKVTKNDLESAENEVVTELYQNGLKIIKQLEENNNLISEEKEALLEECQKMIQEYEVFLNNQRSNN